jgi:hypothetical protein
MFDHNKKADEVKSPCLIGAAGEFEGRVIQLLDKLSLGRHQKNDVCFQNRAVSGFHAEITKVNNNYEICDLGSKNRTRVNGRKIFKPTILVNNDLIEIGKDSFRFRLSVADTITVFATMPINDKRPEIKAAEHEDVVYTQKIPKHVFEQTKLTNKHPEHQFVTENVPPPKPEIIPSLSSGKELSKPRKILVNTVSACLALFIIILVLAKSLPQKHTSVRRTNIEKKNVEPIDPTKHSEYIKEIWANWENLPSSAAANTQEAAALLDHAQELFVQTTSEQVAASPDKLWLAYRECLEALSYTNDNAEYAEIRTQCRHLRKAMQIAIEDQENHYYILYLKNNIRSNWNEALNAIECNVQLLNLNSDNKNSTLAKMYRKLAFDVDQNKRREK